MANGPDIFQMLLVSTLSCICIRTYSGTQGHRGTYLVAAPKKFLTDSFPAVLVLNTVDSIKSWTEMAPDCILIFTIFRGD